MNQLKRLGAAVAGAVGFRELLLFAGCTLIGGGLWLVAPPLAFIAPGLALTYVAIAGVK